MTTDTITISIDADALTWGAVEDLEAATSIREIGDWLVAHANVDRTALRALPAAEIKAVGEQIRERLKAALDVPK